MNEKKLCFVIPSLQAGGMERVMSELANYFCQNNEIEVHMVLYGRNPKIFYSTPDNIKMHLPITPFDNRLRQIYSIGRLYFLRRTIKKINPDFILSFGEYWNSFVLLALYNCSYPVFISDRCSPEKKFGIFHSLLRRWLYPKARGVIAQTEIAKNHYKKQFRHNNIAAIGNPIRLISSNGTTKEKIVLSVGRLIKSKNHDKLIELFCSINQHGWKLVIVGGDALKQNNMSRLKNLISSLNADSKVILTGFRNDLDKFYQESGIFVFTSDSEGFPNVIGEAMSASMPVITFDCMAGPSEMIIDRQNGYLVPLYDYSLFRERLEQLMSDEPLRKAMGSKAKDLIQKFSLENIGAKYYDFIILK